ncbi:MAG: acetate uptake transporter [Bacteroidota bacterium]
MEQKLANPAPIGLLGFGMTTILLNIHNAGFFPVTSVILAMGLLFGGITQIIAGILEFKKGNTFGHLAFTSYGTFWIVLVGIWVIPEAGWAKGIATSEGFMGWFLFLWGVFSFFMWIGTFGKNRVIQFVFLSLWILYFLLTLRDWLGMPVLGIIAGYEGILCGASAFYLAMAEVLNETRGKVILPIGARI